MGCREHETNHSVFDVHHTVERERADGLLTVTWPAPGLLDFTSPCSAQMTTYVGKYNTKKKRRNDGVNDGVSLNSVFSALHHLYVIA